MDRGAASLLEGIWVGVLDGQRVCASACGVCGGYTVGTWPCFYLRMGVKVLDGQKGCDVEGSGLGRMVDRGGGGS